MKVLRSRRKRGYMVALVTSFAMAFGAGAASAGAAYSATGYFSAWGINYTNSSSIHITKAPNNGWGFASINAPSNRPAGHIGVLPRNYTSSGALACSGTWTYSSAAYAGMNQNCSFKLIKGRSYYSYGVTRAWTGNGYKSVYTFKSPYQTAG